MNGESEALKLLVAELRMPGAVRQVQLVRQVEDQFYKDFPERAKGKAQAARMNEARRAKKEGRDVEPDSGSTLVSWLCEQLNRKPTPVKNLLTRGRRIPPHVLDHLEERKKDIRGVGLLLDRLAKAFHKDPNMHWEAMIDLHVNGAPLPVPQGLVIAGLFERSAQWSNRDDTAVLVGSDSRAEMERLIGQGVRFDAIVTDPPYRQGRTDIAGDQEDVPLWEVPLFADLVKPGGVVCIWTGDGQVNKWVRACIDAGLGVSGLVLWDKGTGRRYQSDKELMIVCGVKPFTPFTVNFAPTARDAEERQHVNTPKSPELMVDVLERFTKPGDVVLDPFAGTGPVGRAAIRTGRSYFGVELDPTRAVYAIRKLKAEDAKKRGTRVTGRTTLREAAEAARRQMTSEEQMAFLESRVRPAA